MSYDCNMAYIFQPYIFIYNLKYSFLILVPAVTSGNKTSETVTPRNPPKCTLCKQPMKGHKNVTNCPRNQKE